MIAFVDPPWQANPGWWGKAISPLRQYLCPL